MAGCANGKVVTLDDPKIESKLDGFKVVHLDYSPQAVSTLCGLACLTSVLNAWDVNVSQESILKEHPPADLKKGYSLGELRKISEDFELKAYCLEGDSDFLKKHLKAGRPVVIALGEGASDEEGEDTKAPYHSVVVCGFGQDCFLVMDPNLGFLLLKKERLLTTWKQAGNAALLVAR